MAKKVPDLKAARPTTKATTKPFRLVGEEKEGDPRRGAAGPPYEGLERLIQFIPLLVTQFGLFLSSVAEAQLREARTARFVQASDYVTAVASTMKRSPQLLPKFTFGGDDLLFRLQRVTKLDEVVLYLADLLNRIQQTAHLEWADLIDLCDLVVTDVEAQLGRQGLDDGTEEQLRVAVMNALAIWQSRQQDKAQRQTANDTLRAKTQEQTEGLLTAALRRAEAAEAQVQELAARLSSLAAPPAPADGASITVARPNRRRSRTKE